LFEVAAPPSKSLDYNRPKAKTAHIEESDEDFDFNLFGAGKDIPLQTAGLKLQACTAPPKPQVAAFSFESDYEGDDMGFGLFDDDTPLPSTASVKEKSVHDEKKLPEKALDRALDVALTVPKEANQPAAGKHFLENFSYLNQMNIGQNLFF
jgi:hypothetical protein